MLRSVRALLALLALLVQKRRYDAGSLRVRALSEQLQVLRSVRALLALLAVLALLVQTRSM